MKRRTFIKTSSAVVVGGTLAASCGCNAQEVSAAESAKLGDKRVAPGNFPDLVVVHGTDIPKMIEAGVAKLGGWSRFIKNGAKVALKPNVAWKSTPEQGGNTHPDIVRSVVQAAEKCSAAEILIPENTCHTERETFVASGVKAALAGTKAKLYRPKGKDYQEVAVPKGKICKKAKVTRALMEADCLINMPVAKHHTCTEVTISMKNWMGAVDNRTRQSWHRNGLHPCISDFATFLRPTLVIVDATRIMLDHGPQGPGTLKHPHEIIFSTDPVAADAYATTLFGKKPHDIGYIRLAEEKGVGSADLAKLKIERVEA